MRSQTYGDKQREAQRRKKQEELGRKSSPQGVPTSGTPTNAAKSDQAANKGSLLSEEQEEAANGRKNDFRHLLSALQFPQERQGVFFN
jgi:hypothetical protein